MWSKPTWISDQHYLDWIFLEYENNHLFNFPIWSYVKVKSCGVCHLGFLIDTKTHTFCKGPSEEYSNFALWWWPSWIFFSIETPLKTLFFLNLISIEKPLELNLKTIGFYLKLHWISIYLAKYANGHDHFNDVIN